MAAVIPFMMAAGAAISAMGAMSQAKAQATGHTYTAAINDQNAQIALSQATMKAATLRRQADLAHGSLIAGYGTSGVTMEGSPTDALKMSVENAALDEANILYEGRLKSIGYTNEAALNRVAAKNATNQGYLNAASSILTGAGRTVYGSTMMSKGTPITRGSEFGTLLNEGAA